MGAAFTFWHVELGNKRIINSKDDMNGSFLGTEYKQEDIEKELKSIGANFKTLDYEDLIDKTSEVLTNEKVIGWFQERMEFGPRALGADRFWETQGLPVCKKI